MLKILFTLYYLIILFSCSSSPKYVDFINNDKDFSNQSGLLNSTKVISLKAGIGSLKDNSYHVEDREIRIWYGFGVVRPDFMMQIENKSGEISGNIHIFYDKDLSYMKDNEDTFKDWVESLCKKVLVKNDYDFMCIADFPNKPNWKYYYKKLVKNNIYNLIDESKLPEPEIYIHDANAMAVEIRDGEKYREYEYSYNVFRKEYEAHQASEIMSVIHELIGKIY